METDTDLFNFNETDGALPVADLIISGSNLYGMTVEGGVKNYGVIFGYNLNYVPTGVNTLKTNPGIINLYPNPTNGTFTIALTNLGIIKENRSHIEIYNILGEKISTVNVKTTNTEIVLSELSGIYLYRLITEDGKLEGEGKFVIQK